MAAEHSRKPLLCEQVYVAGPMTGYEGYNFAAFDAARDRLLADGFSVISPADISRPYIERGEWPAKAHEVMRHDVEAVLTCDAIYMLTGWENSVGARAEHALALWFGKRIRYEVGAHG